MGCCGIDPEGLKKIPYESKVDENFSGSVQVREETDRPFKFILLGCIVVLLGFVFYCSLYSDIYRDLYGYDNCGNVCGRKNEKEVDPQFACKGQDLTHKKLLQLSSIEESYDQIKARRCVDKCETDFVDMNNLQCWPAKNEYGQTIKYVGNPEDTEYLEKAWEHLKSAKFEILELCLFAIVFSLIMVYLLRSKPRFIIWLLLILPVFIISLVALILWITYFTYYFGDDSSKTDEDIQLRREASFSCEFGGVCFTVISLIFIVVILVMRKRIDLVIRLFKEAGKAVEDMPLLLIKPFVTFLLLILLTGVMVYFGCQITGAGLLTKNPENGDIYYRQDVFMLFAEYFLLFMWFWLIQFIIGCQHMIIAGSVATWFFTRDKRYLRSPIWTSIKNLVTYHLGTVAFGALILAILSMIRSVVNYVKSSMRDSNNPIAKTAYYMLECLFSMVHSLIVFWTRNAYIQVAMFGSTFCEGGKQAYHIIVTNAFDVAAVNSVGDFVLGFTKVIVVLITALVGVTLMHGKTQKEMTEPLALLIIVAFIVIHCFLTVYEMVIDTLLICFCEDSLVNNGEDKPYFMSKGLMTFVEESNKLAQAAKEKKKKKNETPEAAEATETFL